MRKSSVPIKEFRLELSDLTYTGHDLVRPESVLAQPNGTLWISDGRGGVSRINPDGSQQFIGGLGGNEPNGLAMSTLPPSNPPWPDYPCGIGSAARGDECGPYRDFPRQRFCGG